MKPRFLMFSLFAFLVLSASLFSAQITKVEGLVTIGEEKAPATIGDVLPAGAVVETGDHSSAEIALDDESVIALAPNTQFKIETEIVERKTRTVNGQLAFGSIFAKITKRSGSSKVTIHTPTAVAAVRGTAFAVTATESGEAAFYVSEGSIDVGGQIVKAQMIARVNAEGVVAKPVKAEANDIAAMTAHFDAYAPQPEIEPVRETEAPAPATQELPSGETPARAAEKDSKDASSKPSSKSGERFSMGFGITSVTIDGALWTRINLFPQIPVGKFIFAFDIELFLNGEGKIANRGWDFSTFERGLDSVLRKIYFIQYNQKNNVLRENDHVYAKFGSLDNVTLGKGLVMKRYANTLSYPSVKNLGLDFAVGNISPLKFGLEGVIGSVGDFGRGGALLGGRFYMKPFAPTSVPILSGVQIGASYVADLNQYAGLTDDKRDATGLTYEQKIAANNAIVAAGGGPYFDLSVDEAFRYIEGKKDFFAVGGVDIVVPLFKRFDLYAQAAMNHDIRTDYDALLQHGWGLAPGVSWEIVQNIIELSVEYRQSQGYFEHGYFGQMYDIERSRIVPNGLPPVVTRETLLTDKATTGVFGALDVNLFIINLYLSYEALFGTTAGNEPISAVEARATLNSSFVKSIPVLDKYIGDFEAYAIKKNIVDYATFFKGDLNTMLGLRAGIKLGGATQIIYELTRSYVVNDEGSVVGNNFMAIGAETMF